MLPNQPQVPKRESPAASTASEPPSASDLPYAEAIPMAELVEPTPAEPSASADPENSASAANEDSLAYSIALLAPTGLRRLTESGILFLSIILFLRAIAIEPFGVPTGSMAPTLTGNHRFAACPRCGFPIRVGEPSVGRAGKWNEVDCPNCGQPEINIASRPDIAGDRLLVDKNVFSLRSPKRWEIAVFRCPSDLTKPYVKRVAGLPGERVQIVDGDLYINDDIARKTLKQCREMRIPVFDMNYVPKLTGWQHRWHASPQPNASEGSAILPWLKVDGAILRLQGNQVPELLVWAQYHHARYDPTTGQDRSEPVRDYFVYNGQSYQDQLPINESDARIKLQSVHDFALDLDIDIVSGSGSIQLRVSDGKDEMIAVCSVGESTGDFSLYEKGLGKVRSVNMKRWEAGKTYHVEMYFWDRRCMLAIDGKEVFLPYDLKAVPSRGPTTSPVAIGTQGVQLTVRNMRIYRDIHYRSGDRNASDTALQLEPDEYFMLGDNSANSDDSRSWKIPGVPERNFLGKPFLLHQPSRPSRVDVGGKERIIQAIDWDRIRWLR